MTKQTTIDEINQFDKLPNVAIIPNHGRLDQLPNYPLCAKREIFCGPNLESMDTTHRKYIHTKSYNFKIEEILALLDGEDCNVDLIFAPLEVGSTCFPRNLFKLKFPKVAFIFDTHHLLYPISTIINYLKREKFTHMFIYAQPAHLHFFYEAGIKNAAFYPHIIPKFTNIEKKKYGVTYIGGKWKSSHLRRSRMVQFLKENLPRNNIPFHHYNQLPRAFWHKVLARSNIIVLSSLNGQFTPQITSVLSAGALCFIDELSPQTALYRFFKPGKHLIVWTDFDDLLDKLIFYHSHPEEAEKIAKAGKLQVEKNFLANNNLAHTISEFVFESKIDQRLLATNDKRAQHPFHENSDLFNARVRLYENVQDLHRIHENIQLISLTNQYLISSSDLADLPRLKMTHAFADDQLKEKADLYFQEVGVEDQIVTTTFNKLNQKSIYDIGLLETQDNLSDWKFLIRYISLLLKPNSLLWVFDKLTSDECNVLEKHGFKTYRVSDNPLFNKIKNISRILCFQMWKYGTYPFPYLTLKPRMKSVPHLNVFIRGWQGKFPFLY